MQDADKQRPYYGRGVVLFARVSRSSDANMPAWVVDGYARFYAENEPMHPMPSIVGTPLVCVLRAGPRASCVLAPVRPACWPPCVLRAGPRASCVLARLRPACGPPCVLRAGPRASCMLRHSTCLAFSRRGRVSAFAEAGLDARCDAARLGAQVGVDERVHVPVEIAVGIAALEVGAVILDDIVGMNRHGANLRAEIGLHKLALQLRGLFRALLHLKLVEARLE